MDIYEKALALHKEHHGKMEINVKVPMETMEDLSMAYTPGVAQPCREIHTIQKLFMIIHGRVIVWQ